MPRQIARSTPSCSSRALRTPRTAPRAPATGTARRADAPSRSRPTASMPRAPRSGTRDRVAAVLDVEPRGELVRERLVAGVLVLGRERDRALVGVECLAVAPLDAMQLRAHQRRLVQEVLRRTARPKSISAVSSPGSRTTTLAGLMSPCHHTGVVEPTQRGRDL